MVFWRRLLVVASLAAVASAADAQRSPATEAQRQQAEAALARFTSPTLTRFSSEAEFRAYVEAVHAVRRGRWAQSRRILLAQAEAQGGAQSDATEEPICSPDDPACGGAEEIVTTATRVSPSNPSITNNQMGGVEEGDIVKQIGHHLLILQDGRIFVADIGAGGGRRLALTDRINVYRDADSDTWYDEMLVFGDRVLITGYSYEEDASELSVFRLRPNGTLAREGVFYISSDDYYSTTNYATRLIGDNLIIYTPFGLDAIADDEFKWPVVRRWISGEEREEAIERGRRLFDARGIYRPLARLDDPTVHSVSICPLGEAGGGRDLACRTTAFVADNEAQWYVTRTDAFVWTARDPGYRSADRDCVANEAIEARHTVPALVYRLPTTGGAPTVIAAHGMPIDQFSMQEFEGGFRALLRWQPESCNEDWDAPARLRFFDVPVRAFGGSVGGAGPGRYTAMPGVGSRFVANRFTDRHLVYGGLSRYRRGLPSWDDEGDADEETLARRRRLTAMPPAYVVPVGRPEAVRPLEIRHTVIRAERVGDDIVLTGYRDRLGLRVTLIDLDGTPRIAGSVRLDGRFESEGRSHAFNSMVEPNGSGLLGVPTVPRIRESSRNYWRSRASDLSYLEMNRDGDLAALGELRSRVDYEDGDEDGSPDYQCEVSCIDWYGNSRPIFTGGRVFGLTGIELIEGFVSGGRVRELRRLDLTGRPGR